MKTKFFDSMVQKNLGILMLIIQLSQKKNNSKYLIRYLNEILRPLVLILRKLSGYFKDKDGDKNKNKNNILMSFRIVNNKLLEKYEIIWTKIEDLQNIGLMALPVYDDRFIKTKIRTDGDKVYTNFRILQRESERYFLVRASEHLGMTPLTGKRVKTPKSQLSLTTFC